MYVTRWRSMVITLRLAIAFAFDGIESDQSLPGNNFVYSFSERVSLVHISPEQT